MIEEDKKIHRAAFDGPAVFCNEASVTTDPKNHLHRIAFIEVDINGQPRHRCAVLVNDDMLNRLTEIFGERLNRPGIIKPEHYGAH